MTLAAAEYDLSASWARVGSGLEARGLLAKEDAETLQLYDAFAQLINCRKPRTDQVGSDQCKGCAFGVFKHKSAKKQRVVLADVRPDVMHDLHPDWWRDHYFHDGWKGNTNTA